MHFVPLYTAQRQQLHSVHINAAWIKCQGHFLVAFSCCCCCCSAASGDDATCFSQTVARFMLRPPRPPAVACCCPAACPCEVMLSCLRVCECVPENALQHSSKWRKCITNTTHKQTDRQPQQRERKGEKGRPRATAAERGVNHHGQQAGGQWATGNGQEIRRAVMPVKMNAISSHRKWCQNVSRGPVEAPFLPLSLPACTAARTAASCCYPGELWVLQSCAISNRTKRTPRLSSLCLASSTPLTLPGMPCNSSHGHGAAEQHAEHTGVLIVIVHIVILVVAVVGLRVCAKNSQFIPEWPQLN